MTSEQFQALRAGDIINRVDNGEGYIVVGDVRGLLQAVRVVAIGSPELWNLGSAKPNRTLVQEKAGPPSYFA